jgi:hypothetical protein
MEVLLNNILVQKTKDTPLALFELWENDIVHIQIKPGASISMAEIHIARQIIKEFTNNKEFSLLLDTKTDYNINNDAREFLASRSLYNRKAMAVVVRTFAAKLSVSVFMKFYKLSTPVKIFNTKSNALAWLYDLG